MKASFKSEHKPRNSFQVKNRAMSEEKVKKVESIIFMAVDDEHMGMHLPYSLSNDTIKILIKENGGNWCHNFKIWKIPKYSYTLIRTEIPRIVPQITIEDLPLFIEKALKNVTEKLPINTMSKTLLYEPMDRLINIENNQIFPKLYNYQKQTLALAVKNYGRLLIADEMGVGKSVQGLACALLYEKDWPLLIICPSALKFVWKDEIKKWLGNKFDSNQVFVCQKSGHQIDLKVHKIVIFSYEIAIKSLNKIEDFKIAIADEAHYLKNITAKRTQSLVPFLQSRKRVFLLSGTPALSKPRQLYTLIQIIRPDIFYSIKEFGDRYCYMTKNPWNYRLEYDGCRNTAELHYILKNRIMIRRMKDEVLGELPQKQRQFILVDSSKSHVKKIKELMSSKEIPLDILRNSQKLLESAKDENPNNSVSPLPKCYLLTGLAKIDSIKSYLSALLDNEVKVIIFAHHQEVLNEIADQVQKMKIQYIRIDGQTGMQTRRKNVRAFQDNFNIRAAILSITAAGLGITLTAASVVVFAEMHWTPSILLQAQDRAHRVGQKSCVNVHYLIGENTLDSLLLRQLQSKLETTGQILNGAKQILSGQAIEKGELGKWSPLALSQRKRVPEKTLLDYITIKKTDPKQANSQRSQMEELCATLRNGEVSSEDIDEEDGIQEQELERMIQKKESEFQMKQQKEEERVPQK